VSREIPGQTPRDHQYPPLLHSLKWERQPKALPVAEPESLIKEGITELKSSYLSLKPS